MSAPRTAHALAAASLGALLLGLAGTGFAEETAAPEDPNKVTANIGVVSNYMWRGVTQTQDAAAVQGGVDYAHASGFTAGVWASNVDFENEGAPQTVTIPVDPATGLPATDADGNYVGTTSGTDNPNLPTYEVDFYLGYGGKITDDLSWNVNAIYYAYPDGRNSNFAEVGGGMTFKWFTLGLAYTVYGQNDNGLYDNGDWYYFGKFAYTELPFGLGIAARAGYYDFANGDIVTGAYVDSAGNIVDLTDTADYWHYGASISKDAGDYGVFSLNWDQNSGNQAVGYDNDPKIWVGWNKTF
jgi:uncharacterized protein (TIGR02001 family)